MKLQTLERSARRQVAHWMLGLVLALPFVGCSGKLDLTKPDARSSGGSLAPPKKPDPGATPAPAAAHLLQIIEIEPATGQVRTLLARRVAQALPRRRSSPPGLVWRVQTLNQHGRVLDEVAIADPSRIRAEFSSDGQLAGTSLEKPVVAIPLRLPLLPTAERIRLQNSRGETLGEVAYQQVSP